MSGRLGDGSRLAGREMGCVWVRCRSLRLRLEDDATLRHVVLEVASCNKYGVRGVWAC